MPDRLRRIRLPNAVLTWEPMHDGVISSYIAEMISMYGVKVEQDPDDSECDRSFPDLFAGKIGSLMIAIAVTNTRATRETPMSGVWRLTRDQFVRILENLQSTDRFKDQSLEQIALICDETGIENRFFRLNAAVAAWIDDNEPEIVYDYTLA